MKLYRIVFYGFLSAAALLGLRSIGVIDRASINDKINQYYEQSVKNYGIHNMDRLMNSEQNQLGIRHNGAPKLELRYPFPYCEQYIPRDETLLNRP